jgi:hypothetical protein
MLEYGAEQCELRRKVCGRPGDGWLFQGVRLDKRTPLVEILILA